MKSIYIKILRACIFILIVFAYPQQNDSKNCDSLKTEYKNKITEWKAVFKEITSDKITGTQYDSLLSIYKQKWDKAHESQILFINCKHPLVKITVENFENPPLIPSFKNKTNLSETTALNQLCKSLKSTNNSYMFSFSECERRLKNYDYFTANDYDSLRMYAGYFIGEALKFSKYYTECSADSLFDANFQAKMRVIPEPPFIIDENYFENKFEYFKTFELTDESVFKMKEFLTENYPPDALFEGISGKVRFGFRFDTNGEPTDIKVLYEIPIVYGFCELTEQAVKLLELKPAEIEEAPIHTEMIGSVNFKLNMRQQEIKKVIEIQIKPFYNGRQQSP